MANVPLRAVSALLPPKWSAYLQKALAPQVKGDPRQLVDAAMIADVLSKASATDPERAVVQRFLTVVRSYDQVAGAQPDVGTIAEYSPLETLLIKRRTDPEDVGPPSELSLPIANLIELLAGKATKPAPAMIKAADGETEEQHPLDKQLADLVAPSTALADLLSRSADRRQRDGNWVTKPSTRQIVQKLETAKIPVNTSTFELSYEPNAVVFDRVSGGLLEMIARHSFGGRKKLLAINAGGPIAPELLERLTALGATEVINFDKVDTKQLKAIGEKLQTWASERHGEVENAVNASGFTAASELWSTAMDELAAIAQGGNAALVYGKEAEFAEAFLATLQGETPRATEASSNEDLKALLGMESPSVVIRNIDQLSAQNQATLRDYLLSTANVANAPGALRAQRIIGTTTRDLSALVDLGKFDRNLASLLAPGTVKLPSLIQRTEDVVPAAGAFLAKAYGTEDAATCAAVASIAGDAGIRHHLQARYSGSFTALKDLMARIAAAAPADQPLTLELVQAHDQPQYARSQAIDAALKEVDLTAAGLPFKTAVARAIDALAEQPIQLISVPGPELQLELEKILESAARTLGESLGPVERIDVEALQGQGNVETISEALANALTGGEARSVVLVSYENLPKPVQDGLVVQLDQLRASGHIKRVLVPTAVDERMYMREEFSTTLRWAMSANEPIKLPMPEDGVGNAKDRKALDARREERLERERQAALDQQQAAEREAEDRTNDQRVKVQRRADRGQPFDDLAKDLPAAFISEMTNRMHAVRLEKFPEEISARAKKGELFDDLSAMLIESGKALGKPVDETLVSNGRLSVLETRLKEWPEKIKARVAADEFFDDLISEYRNAAKALGRKPNDAIFNPLTDKMRKHMERRAESGESFAVYQEEYQRAMKANSAIVSTVFLVKLKQKMVAARLAEWPNKIQQAAEQGRDIKKLKHELVEAWNFESQPVDTDFLDRMTALSAQVRGED